MPSNDTPVSKTQAIRQYLGERVYFNFNCIILDVCEVRIGDYTFFGVVGNLVIGVIGAVLGGFLFRLVGLLPIGLIGSLVSATVGAVVLLFLLQRFGRRI